MPAAANNAPFTPSAVSPAAGMAAKPNATAGASYPGLSGNATGMAPGMVAGTATGTMPPLTMNNSVITPTGATFPPLATQESYVENILRMNLGKVGTFYMTYENNSEWNAKIFKGVVEAAGRDHIIISDPVTGKRYLLLMLNLDYITFDEPLNYNLPFGSAGQAGLSTRFR
ncbi:spore coat protein GerQ [Cohnella sp. CBP 2801]|uniref:Spore coat protein GerQ n=2 Tax=Cohnella zeiphila TaxID=2761120 RepID=A0A7X0SMY5_9BACL|nr:spore coat protein GerQ [Cohnella zeiphila]